MEVRRCRRGRCSKEHLGQVRGSTGHLGLGSPQSRGEMSIPETSIWVKVALLAGDPGRLREERRREAREGGSQQDGEHSREHVVHVAQSHGALGPRGRRPRPTTSAASASSQSI